MDEPVTREEFDNGLNCYPGYFINDLEVVYPKGITVIYLSPNESFEVKIKAPSTVAFYPAVFIDITPQEGLVTTETNSEYTSFILQFKAKGEYAFYVFSYGHEKRYSISLMYKVVVE